MQVDVGVVAEGLVLLEGPVLPSGRGGGLTRAVPQTAERAVYGALGRMQGRFAARLRKMVALMFAAVVNPCALSVALLGLHAARARLRRRAVRVGDGAGRGVGPRELHCPVRWDTHLA